MCAVPLKVFLHDIPIDPKVVTIKCVKIRWFKPEPHLDNILIKKV